jgi:hypothetical protein
MAREEPIQPLPAEGGTRERDPGAEVAGSDKDQVPTPVVWLPSDEE